jgi:anti-sigma B factor antagonist
MNLTILRERPAEPVLVLKLEGELDIRTAPLLREALMESDRRIHTILSLAGLYLVDSTALGVMIGAMRRARDIGGDLVLADVPANIIRVLEVTGLTKVFKVYPTIADALAVLGPVH